MSSPLDPVIPPGLRGLHLVGLAAFKKNWGWLVGVGAVLILFGGMAIGQSVLTTLAVSAFVGALLLIAGVLQTTQAFMLREWGGFPLSLASGILNVVIGFMMLTNPVTAAEALTILIAVFLFLGGCFRIAAGLSTEFNHRGWVIFSGAVSLLLAFSIWANWPMSALQVIGIFVGIDMLMEGISLVMLGLAARRLPAP